MKYGSKEWIEAKKDFELGRYGKYVTKDFKGFLHSYEDEPAVICENGDIYFYHHGKKHRDGGRPAVVYATGEVEYWVFGVRQDLEKESEENEVIQN